jgi:5-methylcytosine-specific restriction endonuclease McrA
MIIQKDIEVVLNGANVKYYEDLGYFIPRYLYTKNYQNNWRVKRGTSIIVKIKDLQRVSSVKVLCKCDKCGEENCINYGTLTNPSTYYCLKCSHNTKEYKEMLSKTHKGKIITKEVRKKLSENSYNKGKFGEDNPRWNFNKTNEERVKGRNISGNDSWKRKVKKRDKYICQCCGYVGKINDGILEAHHLYNYDNFNEKRLEVDNGVTLCFGCHKAKNGKSLHNLYGYNITKIEYDDFIKNYKRIRP